MKTAFLYAGQGAQHIGMGTDLYEKYEDYRKAVDDVLSVETMSVKKLMDDGPEETLKETENTQPAMALFAIGVTEVLKSNGITPNLACGLSIGEYGALYSAGVLSAKDYLDIVTYRGKVMSDAAKGLKCSMSAVIGLGKEDVEKAVSKSLDKGYVTVSNYNCTGQYVICGEDDAIEYCEGLCINAGAKQCIRLNVSGPFHTKYMKEAGEKLGNKLKEYTFSRTEIPVLLNVSGEYLLEDDDLNDVLVKQIQSSVRFEDEIRKMLSDNVDTFIEIGPGKTLAGFVKKTAKSMGIKANTFSIDTVEDLEKCLDALCAK